MSASNNIDRLCVSVKVTNALVRISKKHISLYVEDNLWQFVHLETVKCDQNKQVIYITAVILVHFTLSANSVGLNMYLCVSSADFLLEGTGLRVLTQKYRDLKGF